MLPEAPSTMILRGNGVALWRQIADCLRQDIRRQSLRPGDRLPTESQLASRFGVNRHTVRQAVATLADEGILSVEQGRGTFVPERLFHYPVGKRTRFTANILRTDSSPAHDLLYTGIESADEETAAALGLHLGEAVVVARLLSKVDGRPVAVADHRFSARRFPGMPEAFRDAPSVTQVLRRMGIADYTRRETRMTARAASAEEADLLRLPRGRALLITDAVNVDPQERPLEFGTTLFAADRVQLVIES